MPRPLIPPRGVLVPSSVQYDKSIPPAVRDTYNQTLGLAYGRSETPPVSFQQLSELFGKSISTLRGHLAVLRDRGVLRWRTAQDSTIIISFPRGTSKGEAFFNEGADSKKLEKPVKEEEDESNKLKFNLNPPPPNSVKKSVAKKEKYAFSVELRKKLLEAGVFKNKLPELAQAGLSEAEIMAVLRKVQDEFGGEQKGGIVVHRVKENIIPPKAYFNEPCGVCAQFDSHAPNCMQGIREKYLCPDCGMATCTCEVDADISVSYSPSSVSSLSDTAQKAWQTVLRQLQSEMPRASYETWVRETQPLSLNDATLVIGVRDNHTREICESRLKKTVSNLLIGILNTANTDVKFVVMEAAL